MCAALTEVKDYQRDFLLPVTAQLPSQTSMVSSILEQHTADLSSAQEWDTEWKSQGLLSRLTPQVRPAPRQKSVVVLSEGMNTFSSFSVSSLHGFHLSVQHLKGHNQLCHV